jgi:hypothetical protein
MKTIIFSAFISVLTIFTAKAQNPYKYESKVITVSTTRTDDSYKRLITTISVGGFNKVKIWEKSTSYNLKSESFQGYNVTIQEALAMVHKNINDNGFTLKSAIGNTDITGTGSVTLFFEKSDSYREAELYKLINELTTRIDATSKKHTDSAMIAIQTNVLNYLKSIPNEVITQAYKDELTKIILSEAEDKIKKVVEELKKEIRNQSNN